MILRIFPRNLRHLRHLRADFQWTRYYTQATLKFMELNTQAQQREAVVQGRSL
ncbi:MAG: hypothetical protein LBJ00_01880 [Planctomycetaceae bacterium]|nr:hypothetical protein [Planctomycetaceae bacterium]